MKCLPFSAQRADHVLHPAGKGVGSGVRKAVVSNKRRRSVRTLQIKNSVLVSIQHMDVRRHVVIQINHDARSADAKNRWHVFTLSVDGLQVNPNAWVFLALSFFACRQWSGRKSKLMEHARLPLSAGWLTRSFLPTINYPAQATGIE
jgi:hypothetical protein